jgi:caffeoyl-CoA O-methyltransferase
MNHDELLTNYVLDHTSPESPLLAQLNRQTWLDAVQPRMLSGHLQGKLLEMVSCMVRPHYILEIGTFTGYSAICLAKGLQPGGRLVTLEIDDELESMAREYFKKAGFENAIELIIGNANDWVPGLPYVFDLAFIDADKREYITYYESVLNKLKPGGFILADNVLWNGKVVDPSQRNDPDTKAILDFNTHVANDPRTENLILPIRDGISIIRKL